VSDIAQDADIQLEWMKSCRIILNVWFAPVDVAQGFLRYKDRFGEGSEPRPTEAMCTLSAVEWAQLDPSRCALDDNVEAKPARARIYFLSDPKIGEWCEERIRRRTEKSIA